jgi:hypothetical protein
VALHRSLRTAQRSRDLDLRKIVVVAKHDDCALPWWEDPKRRQHHQPVGDAADSVGAAGLLGRLEQLDMSPALSATPDSGVYEDLPARRPRSRPPRVSDRV